MENKIDNRIKKQSYTFIPLLPAYFKTIGLSILILAFLPAIIVKIQDIDLIESQKETLKYLSMNFFILGMFLIAWAKDKVEDELTISLRIKSIVFSFLLAVFGVIFKPLSDMFIGYKIADMKGQDVVFGMLVIYFIIYYLQRKGR